MQLRDYLPKSLFSRMLAIILIPMILVQLVTVFIFYERHWDSVTRQMAHALAGEIALLADRAGNQMQAEDLPALQKSSGNYFGFGLAFEEGAILASTPPVPANYAEQAFFEALDSRLVWPWQADLRGDADLISIDIQTANGVLRIFVGRKRIFSSTSWSFLGWTIGSSLLLFCIALLFMRRQVRPIRRLADAARQLGLGRERVDYQLEGAKEVRLAGRAFRAMQHRIRRHVNERTTMLAGVSHDLRTPLTRMKLQTAMLPASPEISALEEDILEMERMVDGYLAFARGEAGEKAVTTDISALLADSVRRFVAEDAARLELILSTEEIPAFEMRVQSMRRALDNILANALRYAGRAEIRLRLGDDEVQIIVDDDGPGIPPDLRDEAIRPFKRLEGSRNRETGGTGLGLSIANDIILSHGGDLYLEDSPLGGLRVRLRLPI